MSDGDWIELHVELGAEAAELVAAALSPLTGGVEVRDAETVFPTAPDRCGVIALCRPDEADAVLATIDETVALARAAGTAVDPVTIRRRQAHEDEWRDKWKQFFRATRIGRRFVVRPSWDAGADLASEFVIDLDPGRAFGTGAHPSTRLVIRFIEELGEGPSEFLDLGCGSGILSIAAARLWPRARGLAVDVDAESVACAGENLERNGITTVALRAGTLADVDDGARFALVMANIQADVLTGLAPALAGRLSPQGHLVLSGLLTPDVPAVLAAYEGAGLALRARADEGEWSGLLLSSS